MKSNILACFIALSSFSSFASTSNNTEIFKSFYVCPENEILEVIFVQGEKNNYAIINQENEMIPMMQTVSGSGEQYKAINPDYAYKLLIKGKSAMLLGQDDSIIFNDCVADR